jgi:chromosome partitioning protein
LSMTATPTTDVELTEAATAGLTRLGLDPTTELLAVLRRLIVSVAAWKGGVGKTELSKELAWLLDAVLVDFDWDRGGVTRAWGYRHETRTNAPLLDAIETGRTPRPLTGGDYRANLVPSHPDWGDNQPESEHLTAHLERWSSHWRRPLVIDTHPGGGPATYGAIAAAHVIVVPVVLETRAMEALEGMADELRAYPLIVIPNMISAAPRPMIDWLQRISDTYKIPVGPPIGNYNWLRQRRFRMAVAARTPVPAKNRQFVAEITAVARAVVTYAVEAAGEE